MGSAASKSVQEPSQPIQEKFNFLVEEPNDTIDDLGSDLRNISLNSSDGTLSSNQLVYWERNVAGNAKLRLTRTILTHTDIPTALASRKPSISDPHVFNTSLDFKTDPITAQKSSGRCWLFATTNVLRYSVMKKLGLNEFQLSQSYLFFYDKLEKANYYLELSIQNADLPLDDRRVSHAASNPVNDGGQWDMACNIMQNYGIVPQAIFPESFSSSNSKALNTLVTTKLREDALVLRRAADQLRKSGKITEGKIINILRAKKDKLMGEIFTVLSTTLGSPPRPNETFEWDYLDGNGKAHSWKGSPIQFFKQFTSQQYPPLESFSIIHDPRNETKKLYTVEALGNVWGGRPVLYVNTEIDRLKAAVVNSIKAGQPVFFGCDVGKSSERNAGIMDSEMYEYENAFDIKLGMTKTERLQTGESAMTHAMVISAVHVDEKTGKPIRYKVENSWGPDVGDKGYFVMTDKWFNEFVYQVVVPKKLADKDLLEVFEKGETISFPPWDPLGALA